MVAVPSRSIGALLLALTISGFYIPAQPAQLTLQTLYSFTGENGDGALPDGNLTLGPNGVLYGTTIEGGSAAGGIVFELVPPAVAGGVWTENILYTFTGLHGGPDGASPNGGLALANNGDLYGTTFTGGTYPEHGTVFKLTPPAEPGASWKEAVLYRFKGKTDGSNPAAGLLRTSNGMLYGTTVSGGGGSCTIIGCGTVFELTPPAVAGGPWKETVLHSFSGPDGNSPQATLIRGSDGSLYGTTVKGGGSGCGGNGCGTVFKLTPPTVAGEAWTFELLYTFSGEGDDAFPYAALVFAGNGTGDLYGTASGHTVNPQGMAFKLSPPTAAAAAAGQGWKFDVLYSFLGGNDGGAASGIVVLPHGAIAGITTTGGAANQGTVFKLTPPVSPGAGWTHTKVYSFEGGSGGAQPAQTLTLGENSALYGVTYVGGTLNSTCPPSSSGCGTVFELSDDEPLP